MIFKQHDSGDYRLENYKLADGEVVVMDSGTYVYRNDEGFVPFPAFCITCKYLDIETNCCKQLLNANNEKLVVNPATFYCAKHATYKNGSQ